MRVSLCALLAAATAVSTASDAPVVANNPVGASYIATLPTKEGKPHGSVTAVSGTDGKGVNFAVAISGLPKEGGPFMYHIHEKPVPADGNCTGTGAHLDPYKRGETPLCNSSEKQTCQTGDLSGKYGNFTTESGSFSYLDLYTSTNSADPSFFGNLSVVVHFGNKTRITCANFSIAAPGVSASPSSGYALPTGTGVKNTTVLPSGTGGASTTIGSTFTPSQPTQPPSPSQSTGAGNKVMVAGAGVLAGALALVL